MDRFMMMLELDRLEELIEGYDILEATNGKLTFEQERKRTALLAEQNNLDCQWIFLGYDD